MSNIKLSDFVCHLPSNTYVYKPTAQIWKGSVIKTLLGNNAGEAHLQWYEFMSQLQGKAEETTGDEDFLQ